MKKQKNSLSILSIFNRYIKYCWQYLYWNYFKNNYNKLNIKNFKKHKVNYSPCLNINGIIHIKNIGKITIGKNFKANSGVDYNPIGGDTILRLITSFESSEIYIGDNVGISNSTIVCWNKIEIGNNVMIGGSVKIWDTDFHSLNPIIRISDDNDIKTAPIKIEDNVFIGANSIILKGVTIGKNSIVAAGSVVSRNVPPDVIVAGNPAIIKKNLDKTYLA